MRRYFPVFLLLTLTWFGCTPDGYELDRVDNPYVEEFREAIPAMVDFVTDYVEATPASKRSPSTLVDALVTFGSMSADPIEIRDFLEQGLGISSTVRTSGGLDEEQLSFVLRYHDIVPTVTSLDEMAAHRARVDAEATAALGDDRAAVVLMAGAAIQEWGNFLTEPANRAALEAMVASTQGTAGKVDFRNGSSALKLRLIRQDTGGRDGGPRNNYTVRGNRPPEYDDYYSGWNHAFHLIGGGGGLAGVGAYLGAGVKTGGLLLVVGGVIGHLAYRDKTNDRFNTAMQDFCWAEYVRYQEMLENNEIYMNFPHGYCDVNTGRAKDSVLR